MNNTTPLPDTGGRTEFATGGMRDASVGKGLPSRIPPEAIRRLAKRYEDGEAKYPDREGIPNWMRGIPLSRYHDAIVRHTLKAAEGCTEEDHLGAVLWNAAGWIWTADAIADGRLSAELNDLPFYNHHEEAPAGSRIVGGEINSVFFSSVLGGRDATPPHLRKENWPTVPDGYHHWENRGVGHRVAEDKCVAVIDITDPEDVWQVFRSPMGASPYLCVLEAMRGEVNVGDRVFCLPTTGPGFSSTITGITHRTSGLTYEFSGHPPIDDDNIVEIKPLT